MLDKAGRKALSLVRESYAAAAFLPEPQPRTQLLIP